MADNIKAQGPEEEEPSLFWRIINYIFRDRGFKQ